MRGKLIKAFLLLAALVAIAVVVSILVPGPTPAPPTKPLPVPNGYDTFVKAGEMISSGAIPSSSPAVAYKTMAREELQTLLEDQTNALQLIRTGLQQECQVPLTLAHMSSHMRELSSLRHVGMLLAAEGRLAELEDRPNDAAKSYLNAIKVGFGSAQGGIGIDSMTGTALEALGSQRLPILISRLDAKSCREIIQVLETFDSQREPWNFIMERDRIWARQRTPGIQFRIAAIVSSKAMAASMNRMERRFNDHLTETRRLMIDLAARAYEVEKHQKAKTVADLVPDYLKAVPTDPVTGTNMVLSP